MWFNADMSEQQETFGQIITEACKKTDVSHAELARRLQVAKPRVPAFLRGDNMTEGLFKRCIKALGLDLEIKLVRRRRTT
jgi:plasmid maintenance system antidote protein VapI